MKYHILINSVKTVEQLHNAWTNADYIALLDRFRFPNAANSKPEELKELLAMAITDFEPQEAAAIVLDYKLSEHLNEGQIDQISHDMLIDKVSEEYSDISLHHQLFNINQLLYHAYNGTFLNTKATTVEFQITPNEDVTKEAVLKALDKTLAKNSIIKRLYTDHLAGKEAFNDAESIIWDLQPKGANGYVMTTSEYWMSRDEFTEAEYDVEVIAFESEEEID